MGIWSEGLGCGDASAEYVKTLSFPFQPSAKDALSRIVPEARETARPTERERTISGKMGFDENQRLTRASARGHSM